jgi:hypothetical protein
MSGSSAGSLGPSGVTEAVAARYREILPPRYVVETSGPLLNVKAPGGGGVFFGNFILHLRFLPVKYRMEQFAMMAFGHLPEQIAHAADLFPDVAWSAMGSSCHVKATSNEVHIWYGHSENEDEAILRVRPILRSEFGI